MKFKFQETRPHSVETTKKSHVRNLHLRNSRVPGEKFVKILMGCATVLFTCTLTISYRRVRRQNPGADRSCVMRNPGDSFSHSRIVEFQPAS